MMAPSPLDRLSEEDQRMLMRFATVIADHPESHPNEVTVAPGARDFEYRVAVRDNAVSWIEPSIIHANNVFPRFVSLGLAEELPRPPTAQRLSSGVNYLNLSGRRTYRFTDLAFQELRARRAPSAAEIQQRLGRFLLSRFMANRRGYADERLDWDDVATQIGADREQILTNAQLLIELDYAEDQGMEDSFLEDGYLHLTRSGLAWANAGAPPIPASSSPSVTVNVHVTVQQFLSAVQQADVPDDVKRAATEAASEFEREPTLEKAGKLMQLGANFTQMVEPVAKLISDNLSTIHHVANRIPGL